MIVDLFGLPTLIGLRVKLDRPVDREQPCCLNICMIAAARGPHAGELICASCGQHRGWLSKPTAQWIANVVTRFGAPTTPIVVRKSHDGRYRLRTPIAIPRQTWAQLEEVKRGAESFALMAIPLAAAGPELAARIKRDNETPHPMGPPLNRPPLTDDAPSSDWRPAGADVPDIPPFLQRRPGI
jgi:hypothetical protein